VSVMYHDRSTDGCRYYFRSRCNRARGAKMAGAARRFLVTRRKSTTTEVAFRAAENGSRRILAAGMGRLTQKG